MTKFQRETKGDVLKCLISDIQLLLNSLYKLSRGQGLPFLPPSKNDCSTPFSYATKSKSFTTLNTEGTLYLFHHVTCMTCKENKKKYYSLPDFSYLCQFVDMEQFHEMSNDRAYGGYFPEILLDSEAKFLFLK